NYVRVQATASATPTANGAFALIATPGAGFVTLSWNPVPFSDNFTVMSGTRSGGPYSVVATLPSGTSYIDTNVNNGVTEFYVLVAQLQGGYATSGEAHATPLGTLQPMPPPGLTAVQGGTNIYLSWNSSSGAAGYELVQSLPPYGVLEVSPWESYTFNVPSGTPDSTVFTFKCKAESPSGVWGDPSVATITYYTNASSSGSGTPITLSIGGQTVGYNNMPLSLAGPTNLVLTAALTVTNASSPGTVTFYDGQTPICSAAGPTAQVTWHNVTGGTTHNVYAQFVTGGNIIGGGGGTLYASYSCQLSVSVTPTLASYQTSATDLQLPAPGLPIALSRSYDSRYTNAPGNLGSGWKENWDTGGLTVANGDLATGWANDGTDFTQTHVYVGESISHLITINLPGGGQAFFGPTLSVYGDSSSGYTGALTFTAYAPNEGSLSCAASYYSLSDITVNASGGAFTLGDEDDGPFVITSYAYVAPNGEQYLFDGNGVLQTNLDANTNAVTYSYNSGGQLTNIANANGRQVSFSYATNGAGSWIYVYDSVGPQGDPSSFPSVKYLLTGSGTNASNWHL